MISPLSLGLWRSWLMYYAIPGRQRRKRRLYRQFIRPGDLCFDIGAHVGDRVLAWRALGAQVVAVEPQPHLMQWLRRIYGRSSAITLVEQAVGAAFGQATLYVSQRHPTVTTLSSEWMTAVQRHDSFAGVRWDRAVTVPVTTLDALIAQYGRPAFCKIDVEGYELEVLRGLSQPLPALSFEVIPLALDTALRCLERLADLGDYTFNWAPGESHRFVAADWWSQDQITDYLRHLTPQSGSGDVYARQRGG